MIEITLRTILKLLPLFGDKRKQILQIESGMTIREFLTFLENNYGNEIQKNLIDGEELCRGITMYKNGVSILVLDCLNTNLEDGDDLLIFPPVGGG